MPRAPFFPRSALILYRPRSLEHIERAGINLEIDETMYQRGIANCEFFFFFKLMIFLVCHCWIDDYCIFNFSEKPGFQSPYGHTMDNGMVSRSILINANISTGKLRLPRVKNY